MKENSQVITAAIYDDMKIIGVREKNSNGATHCLIYCVVASSKSSPSQKAVQNSDLNDAVMKLKPHHPPPLLLSPMNY